jgi:hypothetical protein
VLGRDLVFEDFLALSLPVSVLSLETLSVALEILSQLVSLDLSQLSQLLSLSAVAPSLFSLLSLFVALSVVLLYYYYFAFIFFWQQKE